MHQSSRIPTGHLPKLSLQERWVSLAQGTPLEAEWERQTPQGHSILPQPEARFLPGWRLALGQESLRH